MPSERNTARHHRVAAPVTSKKPQSVPESAATVLGRALAAIRIAKLSPERRREIATHASHARVAKHLAAKAERARAAR